MPHEPPPPDSRSHLLRFVQRMTARTGRRYALHGFTLSSWRRRVLLVGAALFAGLLSIIFAEGADAVIEMHRELMHRAPWISLVLAPAGFAALAWVARRFLPGTMGSGIPQSIAATQCDDATVRKELLSLRIALAKIALTLGGLLSGASIGREGPSVQVGASVLHTLAGRRFGRIASTRNLIIAGSGAGIAAAFNTPLAGIMFAIEEMSRHHPFRANSATLTAVIFAGLISLATLGNYTYFGSTPASFGWPGAVWPTLLCGVIGGVLGGGFSRLLVASARGLPGRVGAFARERPIAFAAACGLATALIGIATGGSTYGTGYAESKAALEGSAELPLYFPFAKMLVIWFAFLSGIPGGMFAPALAAGAGIGTLAAHILPDAATPPLMILGMVAFLAALTQSPITAFVIVMEMTANHAMLMPLMATAVIAHGFSKTIAPRPLYVALAEMALNRALKSASAHSAALPRPPGA